MSTSDTCPCDSGKTYAHCCQPFHLNDEKPETAEQLMRSRYCAFVNKLGDYLIATRHPSKRTEDSIVQLQQTFANTTWLGLTVLAMDKGTATDLSGHVTFAAIYQDPDNQDTLVERSLFKKEGSQWYYVEGDFDVGRNEPCWCASGKKFKKCHGQ